MTDQQPAMRAVREVQRIPARFRQPCAMLAIASAACMAEPLPVGAAAAEVKQQCSVAVPSDPHGRWWSYRIVDGRKCWYEGKPMLPKSSLEWPKEVLEHSAFDGRVILNKSANALDSRAAAPELSDTFEARWRARVGPH